MKAKKIHDEQNIIFFFFKGVSKPELAWHSSPELHACRWSLTFLFLCSLATSNFLGKVGDI